MFFRSQDGLLVPHNLPSRNHFVKALQEAFESTLKEVRASFSIASRFATSLGAAAGKQLTLVDTFHSVICPEQPSHGVKQGGGECVEWGGEEDNVLLLLPKSQVSTALWTHLFPGLSIFVLPHLPCPFPGVSHSEQCVPEGTLSWSTSSLCPFPSAHPTSRSAWESFCAPERA